MVKKTCRLLVLLLCLSMLGGFGSVQAQTVSGQDLVNAANTAIRQYTGKDADITVNLSGIARDIAVPEGNVEITATLPYGIRYNTLTLTYVNVLVDGQTASRNLLRFDVKMYQNVLVAARTIAVHNVLQAQDVRYERLDISRLPPGFLTSTEQAVGLQATSFLRPGTVLSGFSMQKPIVVKRGSTVNIVARVGGLEVSTVGMALQDGALDQLIQVQNANSHKIMSVKVLDEANVVVTSFNGK